MRLPGRALPGGLPLEVRCGLSAIDAWSYTPHPQRSIGEREDVGWVPEPSRRVVHVSTSTLTDRAKAAAYRVEQFPPQPMQRLSATVLAINGSPTVNPGPLRELVLPLAQGIRGGVYGQNVLFVSSAFDGVKEFVRDLAVANEISLYWTSSPDRLEDATPLGEVTPTELETLQAVRDAGGGITVSDLATRTGLEPTAAGNRLVNLAKKGYVYRLERPRREGDLYIDPRGPLLVDAGQ